MIYSCNIMMRASDMFKAGGNSLLDEVKHQLILDMEQNNCLNGIADNSSDSDEFYELSDNCTEALNKVIEDNLDFNSKFFNAITIDEDSLYLSSEETFSEDVLSYYVDVTIDVKKLLKLYNIKEEPYED